MLDAGIQALTGPLAHGPRPGASEWIGADSTRSPGEECVEGASGCLTSLRTVDCPPSMLVELTLRTMKFICILAAPRTTWMHFCLDYQSQICDPTGITSVVGRSSLRAGLDEFVDARWRPHLSAEGPAQVSGGAVVVRLLFSTREARRLVRSLEPIGPSCRGRIQSRQIGCASTGRTARGPAHPGCLIRPKPP